MSPTSRSRAPSPSPDYNASTLGLHVVHEPGLPAPLDIIFVHGLGGDSRQTWSKNKDTNLFWPGLWLPLEPDVGKARILSFGYNASFRAGAPKSLSNITDFSKELLYEMAYGRNKDGEDLGIGKVPIIFVVHSMGGLVVKKAYILGQNDEEYQIMTSMISAVVFLATPHRGTNLAEVLNRVLRVSFQSPREFITDLNKSSSSLEGINEEFRHIAPKLSIFSFYETLTTPVGPKRMMVLEKDSSILGYPKEVSRALNADHHDVCKYSSLQDPNYLSVRNALKTLVGRYHAKGIQVMGTQMLDEVKGIEIVLGTTSSSAEDDFITFRRWWLAGTCDWLLEEPATQEWFEYSQDSQLLWFSGPPASGKSIMSTHIIDHLKQAGIDCQYFFFKFGDPTKRSLSGCLRSLAYQIARDIPDFRRILIDLSAQGLRLEKADSILIWQKIFESSLFELELEQPLFWVVDGLDESESPKALLEIFQNLRFSKTPIHLMMFSRRTEPLQLAFDRLSTTMKVRAIENDGRGHTSCDIHVLVEKEIKHLRGSDKLKQQVTDNIMSRASSNFLWVRLVLEEILACHTEAAIQETLDEIPDDMMELYKRMETAILSKRGKSNQTLAKTLLQWTICARQSLTLTELSQALRPEFPEFIDLKRTIQDVCGQFVMVDQTSHVAMVHQTARDYLTQMSESVIAIDTKQAHVLLFQKTISVLVDPRLRAILSQNRSALRDTDPFIFYAATSWMYHLRHAGTTSDETLDALMAMFKGPVVLSWIHSLALVGRLEVLVRAAKVLTTFIQTTRRLNSTKNPLLHRLSDLEQLDMWIVDLIKIVAKFSRHLISEPTCIYKLIPPFCPSNSALYQQFYKPEVAEVAVSGISNHAWNDNLARINLPHEDRAWQICCAGELIAVLGAAGSIYLWNASNFVEVQTLRHHEPVTAMCFNSKGSKLVTYGLRSTKLWSTPSGLLLACTQNPADSKAMAITFGHNDTKIFAAGDDKRIRVIGTDDFNSGWHSLDSALLKEDPYIESTVVNSPMWMAFNGDTTQVGVCYRGFPLSVWSLNENRCIGRCKRAKESRYDGGRASTSWFAVDRFTWNPISGHVIGIYKDGCIFKWHPITDENQEVQSQADEVAASSDGKLFTTSNSNGTVKVWNFAYFSVIYQLSSADLVTGLAFSPDSRRFYDLRGCSVNAWESNSLVRFSEGEEAFSDAASEDQSPHSLSQVSEASLSEYEAVSVVSVAPNKSTYCVGNEEGSALLFDTRSQTSVELARFSNFLSVVHVSWSHDGKYVAVADLGGDIAVRAINQKDSKMGIGVKSMPTPKVNLKGRSIHQMMFNHDASLLLVLSNDCLQMWAMEEQKIKNFAGIENGSSRKWLQHPTQKSYFLGFGTDNVCAYKWDTLEEQTMWMYREDQLGTTRHNSEANYTPSKDSTLDSQHSSLSSDDDQGQVSRVSKATYTQDGRHTLVQIKSTSSQGRITKRILIFEQSAFDDAAGGAALYTFIAPHIGAMIEVPLGILSGSRLVFLDQDLWVCTYRPGLAHVAEGLKRHFFIPRDWTSSDSLENCVMMDDGTILCPREDEVAVVRSRLNAEGF